MMKLVDIEFEYSGEYRQTLELIVPKSPKDEQSSVVRGREQAK